MLVGSGCGRGPRPVAQNVLAPAIALLELEMEPHARTRLLARPLARGVQPQLHVWDPVAQREVARGTGGFFDRAAELEVFNASASGRRYQLLVTAHAAEHSGAVALYRDGRLMAARVQAGGQELSLPGAGVSEFQAAAAPGGTQRALLLGLSRDGELLALDEQSGPTGLPRLAARSGMSRVLVGTLEPEPGRISVYANDRVDRDGDGVGRLLERALGTCDSPRDRWCRRSALERYYDSVPNATRDSDRDGLPDGEELFGVDARALDLPRYGADPRHKDVLVEIDHHAKLHDVGFSEAELAQVAKLFAQGSASDLRNLDGRVGVHVHFDAGFAPSDPEHVTLLGDFGGSGPSRAAEYRAARREDFTPARVGYFRYAFSTRKGRGQATGDALTVNRDLQRVSILAHELGHTLGLSHHGHDSWGQANCKPTYYSIMNYLYQSRLELGFSRRSGRRQDPMRVLERAAAARGMGALLGDSPLELDVRGRDVDWNRDGVISDAPVRASLTWATFKSCGAGEYGKITLAQLPGVDRTPVLAASAGELYALWSDADGALWARRANGDDDAWKVDAPPDAARSAQQVAAVGLPVSQPRRGGIAAVELADHTLALASVNGRGVLALAALDVRARSPARLLMAAQDSAFAGPPTLAWAQVAASRYGAERALDVSPGEPTFLPLMAAGDTAFEGAPALAWGAVAENRYGAERALILLARAADSGALTQWVMRPERAQVSRRAALDAAGEPIHTALTPSLLTLPTGELCGVFPDSDGAIRIFVYQPESDTWLDLSSSAFDAALGPRTHGPVGMAFHHYRSADGAPLGYDPTRGALYLSFSEPEPPNPNNPLLYISEWLDARHPARAQLHMRWRGRLITEWTTTAADSGVALYEDESSDALKALMLEDTRDGRQLTFLPYADGVHEAVLGAGSDFQVMERGICTGIRGENACGDASTGAY